MARSRLDPTWLGLDLNATRARAVAGPGGHAPRPVPLDGGALDLPMAIALEGRHPTVGRAGVALFRQSPHLVCHDFLAQLGEPSQWRAGRHRLDAASGLAQVFQRLAPAIATISGVVAVLPAYLSSAQVVLLGQVTAKARLPLMASVTAPLAATLAAQAEQPFTGLAVVIDADDHALAVATIAVDEEQARLLGERDYPRLGIVAWKRALLDAVAERCIRLSRRDPRDSAAADQLLYDQLDGAFDSCRAGRSADLAIQAAQWFQHLNFQPEELESFCAREARAALAGVIGLVTETSVQGPTLAVLTDAATRLPGLLGAVRGWLGDELPRPSMPSTDDFGEALVPEDVPGQAVLLGPNALAQAAHQLAEQVHRGTVPREHLAQVVPLIGTAAPHNGPPRLRYLDSDYPVQGTSFSIGRQPGCDLVFDSAHYPTVSARHCELVLDPRGYLLRDRSRNGTFVNDRPVVQQTLLQPGDWIRLGPDGPALRFLGNLADQKLGSTA
jgi:hypothetical protein